MQIVIDIPEEDFKLIQSVNNTNLLLLAEARAMLAIKNGTPLPEHYGDLIDRNELLKQYGLENATKYGNKNAEQQKHSYSTMMMYEIADMIEDAETIIPATKEEKQIKKSCANCRYDSGHSSACIECCNYSMWILNQTATKEGAE